MVKLKDEDCELLSFNIERGVCILNVTLNILLEFMIPCYRLVRYFYSC